MSLELEPFLSQNLGQTHEPGFDTTPSTEKPWVHLDLPQKTKTWAVQGVWKGMKTYMMYMCLILVGKWIYA